MNCLEVGKSFLIKAIEELASSSLQTNAGGGKATEKSLNHIRPVY